MVECSCWLEHCYLPLFLPGAFFSEEKWRDFGLNLAVFPVDWGLVYLDKSLFEIAMTAIFLIYILYIRQCHKGSHFLLHALPKHACSSCSTTFICYYNCCEQEVTACCAMCWVNTDTVSSKLLSHGLLDGS